ncbi:MAG: ABA4-like family protein [Chitinophagales bacterium]
MTSTLLFSICNTLVLPQWLLMIVAPKWTVTQKLVRSFAIPLALALVYLVYVFSIFGIEGGGFNSLKQVMTLFQFEEAVLAGWVHYLAFDLLVGSWVLLNGQKNEMNHFFLIPCMLLCFMAGPVGFLLYIVLRFFFGKKTTSIAD